MTKKELAANMLTGLRWNAEMELAAMSDQEILLMFEQSLNRQLPLQLSDIWMVMVVTRAADAFRLKYGGIQ